MNWLIFTLITCIIAISTYMKSRENILKTFPNLFTKGASNYSQGAYLRDDDKYKKRLLAGTIVVVLALGFNGAIWHPAQDRKEIERQHKAYLIGYQEGWNTRCDDLFNYTYYGGAFLYNPGVEVFSGKQRLTQKWCEDLYQKRTSEQAYIQDGGPVPTWQTSVETEQERGNHRGNANSVNLVFKKAPKLCYRNGCITIDDLIEISLQQQYQEDRMRNSG